MEYIRYHASGRLGDFIYQLSVINENFLNTGKKGILYVSTNPEIFAHGLLKAYDDTKSYVSALPYIAEYKLHQGEPYDIDLSAWRWSNLIYKANWNTIFKQTFNVDWGKRPWLMSTKDPRFEDKVLIHCSMNRFPDSIKFNTVFKDIDMKNVLFITQDIAEHTHFCNRTGLSIDVFVPSSLNEFICAIHSCVKFIGNLSSPSTYAYGLHKPCITLLLSGSLDNSHIFGLETIIPTVTIV